MHEPIESLRRLHTECTCGACTLRVVAKLALAALAVGTVTALAVAKVIDLLTP